jgi:hypothetical protein
MNEELLRAIYEREGFQQKGIEFEEFKNDFSSDQQLRREVFTRAGFQDKGISFAEFQTDLGIPAPSSEKNFLDLGVFNDTWVGDFVDDMARAISRGNRSGDAVHDTLVLMQRNSAVTPENVADFIESTKRSQELEQSEEFNEFIEAGGFESWNGWSKFFQNQITIIPELILESGAALFGNKSTGGIIGGIVGGAATVGGIGGAYAGGPGGAVAGAATTALESVPLAIAAASGTLETAGTFSELIQEEIGERGLELNEEGIRQVIGDDKSMDRIYSKALRRGVTIAAIDLLTGKLASTVGGKITQKGLSKAQRAKVGAKKFGVESGGATTGEFAAQLISGEPLDITSGILEGVTELGPATANIAASEAKSLLGFDPNSSQPVYRVNGEKVSRERLEAVIDADTEGILDEEINVEIRNDDELESKLTSAMNATLVARGEQTVDADQQTTETDTQETTPDEPTDNQTTTEDGTDNQGDTTDGEGDGTADQGGREDDTTQGEEVTQEEVSENEGETVQEDTGQGQPVIPEDVEIDTLTDEEISTDLERVDSEIAELNPTEGVSDRLTPIRIEGEERPVVKVGEKYFSLDNEGKVSGNQITDQDKINQFEENAQRVEQLKERRSQLLDRRKSDSGLPSPILSLPKSDITVVKRDGKYFKVDDQGNITNNEVTDQRTIDEYESEAVDFEKSRVEYFKSLEEEYKDVSDDALSDMITDRETYVDPDAEGSDGPAFTVNGISKPITKVGDKYFIVKKDGTPSKREVKNERAIRLYDTYVEDNNREKRRVERLKREQKRRERQTNLDNQNNQTDEIRNQVTESGEGQPVQRSQEVDEGVQANSPQEGEQVQRGPNNLERTEGQGVPQRVDGEPTEGTPPTDEGGGPTSPPQPPPPPDNDGDANADAEGDPDGEGDGNNDGEGDDTGSKSTRYEPLKRTKRRKKGKKSRAKRSRERIKEKYDTVDGVTDKVVELMETRGMSLDEAMAAVKVDYGSLNMTPSALRNAIKATIRKRQNARTNEFNNDQPYADFTLSNWAKFKKWFKKNFIDGLKSTGPFDKNVFKLIERNRGVIQSQIRKARVLADRLQLLTKDLTRAEKDAVDKMLRGGHSDLLGNNIDPKLKSDITYITNLMRQNIDALSSKLEKLGIFDETFLEIIEDNKGSYVNRIYMSRLPQSNWPNQVPRSVFNRAKTVYQRRLQKLLTDGRVSEENKRRIRQVLDSDKAMDDYMMNILTGQEADLAFAVGGMQGTKDPSFFKERKNIEKEIRDFYGEVRDADVNYLNTITKLSRYIANTELLRDIQQVGKEAGFISEIPKRDPDGTQWIEVNKSNSDTLQPLEAPIYMKPEMAEFLAIKQRSRDTWVRLFLTFNGLVKGGKTVLSPVTQMRNIVSGNAWMLANGNFLPSQDADNYTSALKMLQAVDRIEGLDFNDDPDTFLKKLKDKAEKATGYSRTDSEMDKLTRKFYRLIELQVADQNVVSKELNEFLKDYTGNRFDQFLEKNLPGQLGKMARWTGKVVDQMTQFYSNVDDYYRISYYFNQEKLYADALFGKPVSELNEQQLIEVEEKAADVVRDTYPNYSKIYPLVSKLRQFPFLGAFVSFSAEMIRTTRNQILHAIGELRSSNPKLRKNGMKRLLGMGIVSAATFFPLTLMGLIPNDELEELLSDENVEALTTFKAPWVETVIPLRDLGGGTYSTFNPSTVNPYGYFADVLNAGANTGSILSAEGAAMATIKFLEPFLGPEVSVDIATEELRKAMDSNNPDTTPEKIVSGSLAAVKGLLPGFMYSAERLLYPKVDNEELRDNPNAEMEKRINEFISLSGFRVSETNATKTFAFNNGKLLLKMKRRAKRNFNRVYYNEIGKENPDMGKIDEAYEISVQDYNEFLDESKEVINDLRTLGVPETRILELLKDSRVRFDRDTFNKNETNYVMGKTDDYPKLIFKPYNGDEANRTSVRRRRRRR